jgi:hypothetical protein
MRVKSNSWFWYKERLLNILAKDLINQGYKKIIWCDADIKFDSNPFWYEQTAEKLDHYKVVQPFSNCSHSYGPKYWRNKMGSVFGYKNFSNTHTNVDFSEAYHPGFACGLQKCVWDLSLYDYAIKGSGDTVFFKTIFTKDPRELERRMSHKICYVIDRNSYDVWKSKIQNLIDPDKDCDYVSGHIDHFWGGSIENRGYNKRYAMSETIPKIKFGTDVIDDGQLFEWCSDLGRQCESEFKEYLFSRQEDDPVSQS